MTIPDIAGEAESLVRSLRGVRHATIRASEAGIESIHVIAADDEAARHLAAHVRSALLAGLAAPVRPGRIHVRVAHADSPATDHPAPGAGATSLERTGPDHHDDPLPRDRIRILQDAPAVTADEPDDEPVDDAGHEHAHAPALTARPRLVAVDAHRPGDGRVVCRVAIAYGTCVHRAEAVAVDLPGSAAQAAAQATVRALVDAGITGLELSGLREVEIAGRDYVLVALRRTEPYTRTRSGSAPIIGSPERSAAEAAVAAAHAIA